nr:MAG TPA: hypothetical protein [Bacteriophage sp.]
MTPKGLFHAVRFYFFFSHCKQFLVKIKLFIYHSIQFELFQSLLFNL